MAQHKALLTEEGIAVVTVQDARSLTNELLYSDRNYSFVPEHFVRLAAKSGLVLTDVRIAPHEVEGVRHSQMAILRRTGAGVFDGIVSTVASFADALRCALTAWQSLDQVLVAAMAGSDRMFNFGAGMSSFLLACYCPRYWERVAECLIDGLSAEFFGKKVSDPALVSFRKDDHIVLGTRPSAQGDLGPRLARLGPKVSPWDDRIAA